MHAGFLKRVLGALGLALLLSACGGGVGSSTTAAAAQAPQTAATHVALAVAGNVSGRGNIDANVAAASFNFPQAVAADALGNVYVVDGSYTVRRITPAGVVSTLAGVARLSGSADGPGAAARFNVPRGLAVDSSGNVFVADSGNHAIRKITPDGMVSTWAGTAGPPDSGGEDSVAPVGFYYADGYRTEAHFYSPNGLAIDREGNLLVADTDNHVVRKIAPDGMVSTLAGTAGARGFADGNGANARFAYPTGVAADDSGNVYVSDSYNYTVRKINAAGDVSTLAGAVGLAGSADGSGSAARFSFVPGISMDSGGNVLVVDMSKHTVRKITPAGEVSTWVGATGVSGSADGSLTAARFNMPWGLALDAAGNVLIADYGNHLIRRITPAGQVSSLAGSLALAGAEDGTGAEARFQAPQSLAADSLGNVYVADRANSTVRKITPVGVVTTLAGLAGVVGSNDGAGSEARFLYPGGVAVDAQDNVYVADTGNHTIRKISSAGEVSTVAGLAFAAGAVDGTRAVARFRLPLGLAFDSSGNLYVADTGNHTLRKINPQGEVSTLAGTAGLSGRDDGSGAAARFYAPYGIAVDASDTLYVVDASDTTVRRVSLLGEVSTWVGTGGESGSADGMGAAARFDMPQGVATDRRGNVYVADTGNHLVRKITPDGVVSTLAGTAGAMGEKMGATPGALNTPMGICVVGDLVYVSMQNGVVLIR